MSEKIKERNQTINNININSRKRDKFIKPLISDEDFVEKNDAFFSVVKNRTRYDEARRKKEEEKKNTYVSPMRGKLEDKATYPVTSSKGKVDKQYDFLRSSKKLKQDELKREYGSEYYEFKLIKNDRKEPVRKVTIEEKVVIKPIVNNNIDFIEKIENTQLDNIKENLNIIDINNNRINIIYEEEIDIDDNKNIVTSYDEDSKVTFFNDFDKKNINNDNQKFSVQVSEHEIEKPSGLKAELKRLFAEYDDVEVKPQVEFNETIDMKSKPIAKMSSNKLVTQVNSISKSNFEISNEEVNNSFKFVNVKEELKQVTKKNKTNNNENYAQKDLENYKFPSIDLLNEPTEFVADEKEWIEDQIERLDATLESFGIAAKTVNYAQGPSVTRFEVEPEPGTKVSKITALADDIKLRLAASDIRIEAPISGKSTVGVEVPNKKIRMVRVREIIESNAYKTYKSPLKIAIGLDITGEPIYSDISSMTHSLIAGSTGSGKSVCINTIIISILYNAMPDEVKLVLIDPKKVEFSMYRDIPHLITPVISDPKIATATLRWLTEEMDRRYEMIESVGARDIKSYNIKRNRSIEELPKLPYIVVIIDELADLMMIAATEVEEYIQRISQLARAAGIHLIVATQRPSTNVITGTIKTNIPTRIAFKVASSIDSRIILDESGAERLLGKGDMLLSDNGKPHLSRVQGAFISDEEIERVTNFVKDQLSPNYSFTGEELVKKDNEVIVDSDDDLFDDVVRFVIDLGEASASKIQRYFKVGYNRAARIIDMMEKYDIIGPQQNGSKPRDVLMSIEEYEKLIYS
ncbi:MAG: hypothetical protein K0Q49_1262 [Haloplasmataceae bacterium]|nr:hypothetical protein [Haloplasmataceae bacterium]